MKANLFQRSLTTIFGVLIISIGIAWMRFSNFGTDPFVTMNIGISQFSGIPFGTVQMIANLVFLVFMLKFKKESIHLGTVLGIFAVGYASDFVLTLLNILPISLASRIFALSIGLICCCLGVAIYMRAELGIAPYDAAAMIIEENVQTRFKYREIRVVTDLCCVFVGFLFGASIGIGTILTAFFTGPLINFFGKKLDQFSLMHQSQDC